MCDICERLDCSIATLNVIFPMINILEYEIFQYIVLLKILGKKIYHQILNTSSVSFHLHDIHCGPSEWVKSLNLTQADLTLTLDASYTHSHSPPSSGYEPKLPEINIDSFLTA